MENSLLDNTLLLGTNKYEALHCDTGMVKTYLTLNYVISRDFHGDTVAQIVAFSR